MKLKYSITIVLLWFTTWLNAGHIKHIIDRVPENEFVKKEIFLPKAYSDLVNNVGEYVSQFTICNVQAEELSLLAHQENRNIELILPYKGSEITLLLMRSHFIDENLIVTQQNPIGKIPHNYYIGAYYYGVVKELNNAVVAISFFENNIIGLIATDDGNIIIGKTKENNTTDNEYIIYNDKDLLVKDNTSCIQKDIPGTSLPQFSLPKKSRAITTNCVKFYVECDYQMYVDFSNNVTNVTNFASGLFNIVSTLYLNDSVSTSLIQVNVWTTSDPYITANTTGDALDLFSTQMQGGFNGNLAHLLSRRSLGGGIAYLNVLCAIPYYRTGVSANLSTNLTPLPTYSWNSMVVTHEIGHNMGSPHTHACYWNGNNTRIDNCAGNYNVAYQEGNCNSFPPDPVGGGTIMSYCHLSNVGINLSLGFGPQPGALIRNNVNTGVCLTPCANCTADITITGAYSTALTESDTWIRTSGQTTISSTAVVKLDPNPINGYALLRAVNNSDFVLSAPANNNSYFVAQAFDLCNGLGPNIPIFDKGEENTNEATEERNQFFVYPNPNTGVFYLQNNFIENANIHIGIYSIDGKVIQEERDIHFLGKKEIALNNMSKGLYFLKVICDNETTTIKFEVSE